jgi:hypothetical protein
MMDIHKQFRADKLIKVGKGQSHSLLCGDMEFRMMLLYITISNQMAINCWAKIAKKMGIQCPSIIKNTFYSKATTCLKRITSDKSIFSSNTEEKTRMTFYIQCALACIKPGKRRKKKKPNYFETLISEQNLKRDHFISYSSKNGISLSSNQLEMDLKDLVSKYSSSEVVHPITLPSEIQLPIDSERTLIKIGKHSSENYHIEWETKASLTFFLKFPRKFESVGTSEEGAFVLYGQSNALTSNDLKSLS